MLAQSGSDDRGDQCPLLSAKRKSGWALDLSNIERLRTGSGSDTAEKAGIVDRFLKTGLGRGVDMALRLHYGMLRTGGMIATFRRAASGMTNHGAEDIARLVDRASDDPELMMLLLGRKVPVGSPAWNARVTALLGTAEGARSEVQSDDRRSE